MKTPGEKRKQRRPATPPQEHLAEATSPCVLQASCSLLPAPWTSGSLFLSTLLYLTFLLIHLIARASIATSVF